jgi:hypothetical protein
MPEYHELQREAIEAGAGADRMAMGLPCIPDPVRGDMAEIERLRNMVEDACRVFEHYDLPEHALHYRRELDRKQ